MRGCGRAAAAPLDRAGRPADAPSMEWADGVMRRLEPAGVVLTRSHVLHCVSGRPVALAAYGCTGSQCLVPTRTRPFRRRGYKGATVIGGVCSMRPRGPRRLPSSAAGCHRARPAAARPCCGAPRQPARPQRRDRTDGPLVVVVHLPLLDALLLPVAVVPAGILVRVNRPVDVAVRVVDEVLDKDVVDVEYHGGRLYCGL